MKIAWKLCWKNLNLIGLQYFGVFHYEITVNTARKAWLEVCGEPFSTQKRNPP